MRLLVAGSAAVDAGKTTFSAGLCAATDAVGYKPRAGNDYWYDHDDVLAALDERRLYGKDAKRLASASARDVAPEAINPVHRLWLPTPGAGQGMLGREGRAFAVDRVGLAEETQFVVNDTVDLPSEVTDGLPLGGAERVDSLPAFNDAMARLHRPALDAVAERIADEERAVVESYADIARPLSGFVPDAVAVVEPRRARIYRGERYAKACEVASGSAREGQLEERVSRVVDLIDPVARVELPALDARTRGEPARIAAAYAPAYEALLDAT
ncbi:ATPase [Natronomonas sp. EA1]|uniref:ATPase n=1 Tax=Natronomonas sp. EA1 TaxID=3421655 RepID=UPI003EC019B5